MGRNYYGVPASEMGDEDYYYEYEPILVEQNEEEYEQEQTELLRKQQEQESKLSPQHLIIFLMALPLLPIWTALAIVVHSMKIAFFANRNPVKTKQLRLELSGFVFFFVVGLIMYYISIPILIHWWKHIQ